MVCCALCCAAFWPQCTRACWPPVKLCWTPLTWALFKWLFFTLWLYLYLILLCVTPHAADVFKKIAVIH